MIGGFPRYSQIHHLWIRRGKVPQDQAEAAEICYILRQVIHSAEAKMGDVISINKSQRQTRQEAMWQAYLDARDKAESSRSIDDGIAAGKAWARWAESFLGSAS